MIVVQAGRVSCPVDLESGFRVGAAALASSSLVGIFRDLLDELDVSPASGL